MIRRDELGVVCQHDIYDPSKPLDGGDSAARTGILAMCGSLTDRLKMPYFEYFGILKRHPSKHPYNDPRSFSRDQLLQFTAGYLNTDAPIRYPYTARRIFWAHAKRGFFCQNELTIDLQPKPWYARRDILTPSHIAHLLKVAQIPWLNWFVVLARLWLILDILWSTKVRPWDESNQIICMCASEKSNWALKLYTKWHPNWRHTILGYWSGWRNQEEISDTLIRYIEERIK